MPKPREKTVQKSVRIPQSLKDAMEEHERRTHLPEAVQMRVAIEEYLSRQGLLSEDGRKSRRP